MTFSHIVASAKNGVIGNEGDLPWSLPEDMKFFREKTKKHILIMGRKTFDSLHHPLPDRLNIVITRNKDYKKEGALVVSSLEEAKELAKTHLDSYPKEVFIIGGGEIFKQSMNQVDTIYLTLIDKEIKGDSFYPLDDMKDFKKIEETKRETPVPFSFLTYKRK